MYLRYAEFDDLPGKKAVYMLEISYRFSFGLLSHFVMVILGPSIGNYSIFVSFSLAMDPIKGVSNP